MSLPQTALSIAMEGNKNASKARPFTDELRSQLFRDNKRSLNRVIGALVKKAGSGDVAAIQQIADRIEGKVQSQDAQNQIKIIIAKDLSMFAAIVQPESSQEVLEGQSVNVSDETA